VRPHFVGFYEGQKLYSRSASDLLVNTLFEGVSGSGKTTAALDALCFLFWQRPDVPMLLLDGVGTLAQAFTARVSSTMDRRAASGEDMTAQRARLLLLTIQPENESGLSFDLGRRRPKTDSLGAVRVETVHERVDAVMSTLAHTTEGSEEFRLVQTYGSSAFAALVAAGRPLTQLGLLLTHGNEDFHDALRSDLRGPADPYLRAQLGVLKRLLRITARNPSLFEQLTGSTLRNFAWLTLEYADYFRGDTLDYGAFHDRGGVLVVDSSQANPTTAGIFRRALYGIRNAHILSRGTHPSSLVVIDEQEGMNAALYAKHVARARNLNDHHWFLYQSGQQLGDHGEHYAEILAAMQHMVFFRPGDEKAALSVAHRLRTAGLTRRYLQTVTFSSSRSAQSSTTTGTATANGRRNGHGWGIARVTERSENWSVDDSEIATDSGSEMQGGGEQRGKTIGRERVRLGEQLQAVSLGLLGLPNAHAWHIPHAGAPILVRHRRATPTPDARAVLLRVRADQRARFTAPETESVVLPPDDDAPPTLAEAPSLPVQPKTRKDRGRKDNKRHVDAPPKDRA
jgi:hypothetical protein